MRARRASSSSDPSEPDLIDLLGPDILLALDGEPVASPENLMDLLVGGRVSHPATLQVIRGQQSVSVTVTIAERTAAS